MSDELKVLNFEKKHSDLVDLKIKAEELKSRLALHLQNALVVLDEVERSGLTAEFQFMRNSNTKNWDIPIFRVFKEF